MDLSGPGIDVKLKERKKERRKDTHHPQKKQLDVGNI
jgi:hypothetical protein